MISDLKNIEIFSSLAIHEEDRQAEEDQQAQVVAEGQVEAEGQQIVTDSDPPDQEEAVVLSRMIMTNLFIQLQDGDLQNLTIMMNHF